MKPLFHLGNELVRINDILDECDGDLSRLGESEAAMTAWMEHVEADFQANSDLHINCIRELEMRAAAAKEEAERWAKKAKSLSARAEWFTREMLDLMVRAKMLRFTTESGRTVSVVKCGGSLPVVLADPLDPATLPAQFVRYKVEVNRVAVAEALERGEVLAFAHLGERGSRLSIR